ncbi:MAG: DUF6689 family protein [Gammaproteobacteria bacterium]
MSVILLLATAPAHSQTVSAQTVDDRYQASIALSGGVAAELTLRFEGVVGLEPAALGVSVQLVDPLSPSLLARLPNLTSFTIPAAFPMLIQIAPPVGGGFAFEGLYEIELYTRNLHYTAGTPLRIFRAPSGGVFRDVTENVSGGSYRPRGSGGDFSEFLIVADLRSLSTVVNDKFARLSALLNEHGAEIASAPRLTLEQLAAQAHQRWLAGDTEGAADTLSDFEAAVVTAAAAGELPRVWRSARDITNVDGGLRAASRTLRFSLNQVANGL